MTELRAVDEVDRHEGIPPLTRGWRMQMAMDWANVSREHMAMVLGVAPATVSRWLHDQGKRQPRRPDMEIFARECRVPLEWLAPDGEPTLVSSTVARMPVYLAASTDKPRESTSNRPLLSVVRPTAR